MKKGHFHVVTRFRAFQGEIYIWVNKQVLGGGGWVGVRNDFGKQE